MHGYLSILSTCSSELLYRLICFFFFAFVLYFRQVIYHNCLGNHWQSRSLYCLHRDLHLHGRTVPHRNQKLGSWCLFVGCSDWSHSYALCWRISGKYYQRASKSREETVITTVGKLISILRLVAGP